MQLQGVVLPDFWEFTAVVEYSIKATQLQQSRETNGVAPKRAICFIALHTEGDLMETQHRINEVIPSGSMY